MYFQLQWNNNYVNTKQNLLCQAVYPHPRRPSNVKKRLAIIRIQIFENEWEMYHQHYQKNTSYK